MNESTRNKLVRVAGELLAGEGLAAVTLRAVGSRADVSRQTPYRHFTDKNELLAAVASAGLSEIMQSVEAAILSVTDDRERLEVALAAYVQASIARPAFYMLVFSSELSPEAHPELRSVGLQAFGILRALVARTTSDALDEKASIIWAATHGAIMLAIAGHVEAEKGFSDPLAVVRRAIERTLA